MVEGPGWEVNEGSGRVGGDVVVVGGGASVVAVVDVVAAVVGAGAVASVGERALAAAATAAAAAGLVAMAARSSGESAVGLVAGVVAGVLGWVARPECSISWVSGTGEIGRMPSGASLLEPGLWAIAIS